MRRLILGVVLGIALPAMVGCGDAPTTPDSDSLGDMVLDTRALLGANVCVGDEVVVQTKATTGRKARPVKNLAINYVPLSGSVFAATVITNDRGLATQYWKLGQAGENQLAVTAIGPTGAKLLNDVLTVSTTETGTPAAWVDLSAKGPTFVDLVAKLVDNCGNALEGVAWSGTWTNPFFANQPIQGTTIDGVARLSFQSGLAPGLYTMTISAGSLSITVSQNFP